MDGDEVWSSRVVSVNRFFELDGGELDLGQHVRVVIGDTSSELTSEFDVDKLMTTTCRCCAVVRTKDDRGDEGPHFKKKPSLLL